MAGTVCRSNNDFVPVLGKPVKITADDILGLEEYKISFDLPANLFCMRQYGPLYPFRIRYAVSGLLFLGSEFNVLMPDLFGPFKYNCLKFFVFLPEAALSQASATRSTSSTMSS